jgi:hypothetical protein
MLLAYNGVQNLPGEGIADSAHFREEISRSPQKTGLDKSLLVRYKAQPI